MAKYSKVEGHIDLIRDESSSAIINTNVEQYRLVMKRREVMKAQRFEINTLKQEVTEIKGLLKDIIEKLHG
tara:strand:+ start:2656 stop:2868 length:213 start_codon:yes stop_codon:yes gene_type:complete